MSTPFDNIDAIAKLFGQKPESMSEQMTGSARAFPGMVTPGTIMNLYNRPVTQSPAGPNGIQPGNWSTTYSKSFTLDGREVLIPTVINGKFLTDQEAIQHYRRTGEHLGIFDTPAHADAYANALHNSQQAMGNYYGRTSNAMGEPKK